MKKLLITLAVLTLLVSPLLTSATYLDWSTNSYTDAQVIETLYGNGSSYTSERNTQCATGTLSVVHVNPGFDFSNMGNLTTNNTIYILEDGNYPIIDNKLIRGQCIAIVGKGNTNIYTTGQRSEMITLYGVSENIIIDNITLNGITGDPTDHGKDTYGITIQASRGTVTNNTINNNRLSNIEYAINIVGTMNVSNNIFTNNTILNSDYGIYINSSLIGNTSGLIISGNELINNNTGITDNGTSTTIDSNLFSGNTTVGNTGTNPTGTDVMTTITEPTTCTDPNGCICYGTEITNGVQCTDGSRTTVTNGVSCTDPDGCVCGANNINNGASCSISSGGGGGGGGGSSVSTDDCPDGDFTDSYYDGSCGAPNSNGELALGGVIDDDTYGSYGTIAKAHLLANEYEALVAQGETELRHGVFFSIIATYAEMKNRSDTKVSIIIGALKDVFAKMSETLLAKYHFDKTIFLQELDRLIG